MMKDQKKPLILSDILIL